MNTQSQSLTDPAELLGHADFVRRVVRSLIRDENSVDDVVQATWVAALERPPQHRGAMRAWLSRVAKNFALQRHRSTQTREQHEATAGSATELAPSTEEVFAREDRRRRVVELVVELDEPFRSALLLRYFENLTAQQIAARLGVPVGTINSRLHRGLDKLRRELEQHHGGREEWIRALAPIGGLGLTDAEITTLAASSTGLSKIAIAACLLVAGIGLAWAAFGSGLRNAPHELDQAPIATPEPDATPTDATEPQQPFAHRADLPFMRPVPAGTVTLGSTAAELHRSLEIIHPTKREARIVDARRFMAELGSTRVAVKPFHLAKNLLTMKQYEIFVKATGHRPPYDWWRFGAVEDYYERLPAIKVQYPEADNAPLEFWRDNWAKLPWAIPTSRVRGLPRDQKLDEFPVVYVSWHDAAAFAAWAGMRLPTEAEWLLAATGGKRQEFLWGDDLAGMQVKRGPHLDRPMPVGAHGAATRGVFGHEDMCLHVFEWTASSFQPFDRRAFEFERDAFLAHPLWDGLTAAAPAKINSLCGYQPSWGAQKKIAKGAWYGSTDEQLRLGLRAGQAETQVRAGLGFRIAKDPAPARDFARSQIAAQAKPNPIVRDLDIARQLGVEAYELDAEQRLITAYHAVAIVPMRRSTPGHRTPVAMLFVNDPIESA